VLEAWGYVEGWSLTDSGEILAATYHECDLLIAEAMRAGLLDDLEPDELAGLVSVFTYEARGRDAPPAPAYPSRRVRDRAIAIADLASELSRAEDEAGLPQTRPPETGFVAISHGWSSGGELEKLLEEHEMSGGDFVRNVKQLIDLLRQVALVSTNAATRAAADDASRRLFRGVVAASSVVGGAA
jgi:ATP-dependent RNA helicase HelY